MAWETITREGYCLTYPGSPLISPEWIAEQETALEGDATYDHTFCGPQDDPVVMCPNCDQPMLQLFAFDTNDPRLNLPRRAHRLRLIYCLRCSLFHRVVRDPSQWYTAAPEGRLVHIEDPLPHQRWIKVAPFFYRIGGDGSVQLLQYSKEVDLPRTWNNGFGAGNYPVAFPASPVSLLPISVQFLEYIDLVNLRPDLDEADWSMDEEDDKKYEKLGEAEEAVSERRGDWHQYGAEPILAIVPGNSYSIRCPLCDSVMPFLALVADANTSPQGFTGDSCWQMVFHLCRTCTVIAAYSVSGD